MCRRTEGEGRDSFEPRLVFASPCVPRTSYFNETVYSALFPAVSLSPLRAAARLASWFLSSRRLAQNRPTGRLSRLSLVSALVRPSLYFSLSLLSHPPFRASLVHLLSHIAVMHASGLPPPRVPFPPRGRVVAPIEKASRRLRIRRTYDSLMHGCGRREETLLPRRIRNGYYVYRTGDHRVIAIFVNCAPRTDETRGSRA